jgi:extracellular elastinolytic metalloproteinase
MRLLTHRAVPRHGITLAFVLALAVLVSSLAASGASAARGDRDPGFQGEREPLKDRDARKGRKQPTARQRDIVDDRDALVTWNAFGTPQTLVKPGGFLATGLPEDEVEAARAWIGRNRELLRLSEAEVDDLELVSNTEIGEGAAVLFRQRFGDLEPARDGLLAVGVVDGNIAFASSSLTGETQVSNAATIGPEDAFRAAAADAGRPAADVSVVGEADGWTLVQASGFTDLQRVRLAALPTPEEGVRRAYAVFVIDTGDDPVGFLTHVDAATGEVAAREEIVDYLEDNPTWRVFPNTPPLDYSATDTRELWCWRIDAPGCVRQVRDPASPTTPWDVIPRPPAQVTYRTEGNNARSTEFWNHPFPGGAQQGVNYTHSETRDYDYPWTNQWFEEACNPAVFESEQRNDVDAATANLFAQHNRMHDWSYRLGFTEVRFNAQQYNFGRGGAENDPEHGNSQDGAITGGPPNFAGRDNANQFSPADGMVPTTNMFLWQPIAAAFYAPCVDGDFDMSIIGHEYTHLISNRMVAGPISGLSGAQASAMGESWSDLVATEYLREYGFAPVADENPYAVGPYVTRDKHAGIRNYGMNASPLNYSDIGYDIVGVQQHADGEIWSAVNHDVREALNAQYDAQYPSSDQALQEACAEGQRPVTQCPGNRRWAQLVFDAWSLMATGSVSMVDARNALLAADLIRFGVANQATIWNAFAKRGLGFGAASAGASDPDPVPSFESPYSEEATLTFTPTGDAVGQVAQLYVGDYEARAVPIADTDPGTPREATFQLVPGEYSFVARARGYGMVRFTAEVEAGRSRNLRVRMDRNLASSRWGATATGDGTAHANLLDETEGTNWSSLNAPVAGRRVIVRLAPEAVYAVGRVHVSAMLIVGQNRFRALRQFEILTCRARPRVDCSQDDHFELAFTSPEDAFPSVAPRPRAPELIFRAFEVPRTRATHVMLRVVANQCTGGPDYQGEQDNDPRAVSDCSEGSNEDLNVHAAELQVFDR